MRILVSSVLCIIWLATGAARANTSLIDDSGTLPYNAALSMRWQEPRPGPDGNRLVGTLQLRVRLDVSPWLRRHGHIYMVLPVQQPGGMTASWITHGRLLPGQLASGGRALVYSGLIASPFIEDVVQLTLTVDARRMQQAYPVTFRFEMDEP
jgi:hypothetical protein